MDGAEPLLAVNLWHSAHFFQQSDWSGGLSACIQYRTVSVLSYDSDTCSLRSFVFLRIRKGICMAHNSHEEIEFRKSRRRPFHKQYNVIARSGKHARTRRKKAVE